MDFMLIDHRLPYGRHRNRWIFNNLGIMSTVTSVNSSHATVRFNKYVVAYTKTFPNPPSLIFGLIRLKNCPKYR